MKFLKGTCELPKFDCWVCVVYLCANALTFFLGGIVPDPGMLHEVWAVGAAVMAVAMALIGLRVWLFPRTTPKKSSDGLPIPTIFQVVRYGRVVWENCDIEPYRNLHNLCGMCERYKPGAKCHCLVAENLYQSGLANGCAVLVTRCGEFRLKKRLRKDTK